MANANKSTKAANNSTGSTRTRTSATNLNRLTKADLVNIIEGVVQRPITPTQFHRCVVSVASRWVANVVNDRPAPLDELFSKLATLEKIYKNR